MTTDETTESRTGRITEENTQAESIDRENKEFSGSGDRTIEDIELASGLAILESTHEGSSDFTIELSGNCCYPFVESSGSYEGRTAHLVEEGTYDLDIVAGGNWDISILQPTEEANEEPPIEVSGTGNGVVGPYSFDGEYEASVTLQPADDYAVMIYPQQGEVGELVGGVPPGSNLQHSRSSDYTLFEHTFYFSGPGWITVFSNGEWSIEIE